MQKGLLTKVEAARKTLEKRTKKAGETRADVLEREQAAAVLNGLKEPLLNEIELAELYLTSLKEVAAEMEWN